jgi:hypothetical protein
MGTGRRVLTTRAGLEGRLAIGRYLQRALPQLPYGPGAVVRHVLGSAQGGGYDPDATASEMRRLGVIVRQPPAGDGGQHHNAAVAYREQSTDRTGKSWAPLNIAAHHAIDRRKVIGIEPVTRVERERQQHERQNLSRGQ